MKCPICYHQDTKVLDSRVASDGLSIRRRRECQKCGFRFSTFEEVEILDLIIVKRDGRREAYKRDKIISGLHKSFEKRPITEDRFQRLVHSIERDIQKLRTSEVTSGQMGNIIMKHLKAVDKVAYIRFASVYQSFKDVEEFKRELNKLLAEKRPDKKRSVKLSPKNKK